MPLWPGDEIKFINDKSVSTWDDLTSIIHSLPEEEISAFIKRGDELIDYDLETMSSPFFLTADQNRHYWLNWNFSVILYSRHLSIEFYKYRLQQDCW